MSDCDDLAVTLDSDAGRRVDVFYVGALLAVAGEARVERPVGVVADEGEVTGLDLPTRSADHDDLAVTLERHAPGTAEPERIQLLAVAGEARVERAVGVVADEGELAAGSMGSRRHDLAIVLKHHRLRRILSPKISSLLAVSGEARVERAVGVVAGDTKVVGLALPKRSANHDDLAVVLNRNTACIGEVRDRLIAIAREARVERPVGVVAAIADPPTTTIFPSAWSATAAPSPTCFVSFPSPEKLGPAIHSSCSGRRHCRRRERNLCRPPRPSRRAGSQSLPPCWNRGAYRSSACRPRRTLGRGLQSLPWPPTRKQRRPARKQRGQCGDRPSRPHDCHHSRSLPWVCTTYHQCGAPIPGAVDIPSGAHSLPVTVGQNAVHSARIPGNRA